MSNLITNKLIISEVEPGSACEIAGLLPGDVVVQVNGADIRDIIDFQFSASEAELSFEIERGGLKLVREVAREYGEELGLSFEAELPDGIDTCVNRCVFCFVHQMPKGMRKSLYLRDDDFRLSFFQGSYVTLTNMTDEDFARIIEQGLSPLYVSVHTTDPSLRGFLLGLPQPAPVLPQLRYLAENGVEINAQIVLCPGLNDGLALDRTLDELAELHPEKTGLRGGVNSVAIVPVGLSKYRDKLFPLKRVVSEYSCRMLANIKKKHRRYLAELGTRFAFLSDEWFFSAGLPVPSRAWYEGFPQFEDGVGTCRMFLDEAKRLSKRLPDQLTHPFACTLVTGRLASETVSSFAERLNQIDGLTVNVCEVPNHFFGETISVTGLLTAQDIAASLRKFTPHPTIFIPTICLRDENLFLDDVTLDELRQNTGFNLQPIVPTPSALWDAIKSF